MPPDDKIGCRWRRRPTRVVMMAAAQGLGQIDDAGFVKVYEAFTGKRIADQID